MAFRININPDALARQAKEAAVAALRRKGDAIGGLVTSQCKRRFDTSGDADRRWPDLWVNKRGAVLQSAERAHPDLRESRLLLKEDVHKAERSLERARAKVAKGSGNRGAVRRAQNRLRYAKEAQSTGNPAYRAGGKPLLDTGEARASMTYRVRDIPRGVALDVGSPKPWLKGHQTGYATKGPNYIPLTRRAKAKPAGANPADLDLVPGYDYIMAWNGVTVPARPIVRFTEANHREIAQTLRRA